MQVYRLGRYGNIIVWGAQGVVVQLSPMASEGCFRQRRFQTTFGWNSAGGGGCSRRWSGLSIPRISRVLRSLNTARLRMCCVCTLQCLQSDVYTCRGDAHRLLHIPVPTIPAERDADYAANERDSDVPACLPSVDYTAREREADHTAKERAS